jgi:hypothetical protein
MLSLLMSPPLSHIHIPMVRSSANNVINIHDVVGVAVVEVLVGHALGGVCEDAPWVEGGEVLEGSVGAPVHVCQSY